MESAPIAVAVPPRSLSGDLRAVRVVWKRDLLRFAADKPRIFVTLLQPMLYLFVLGSGLSAMMPARGSVDLRTFLFPGVAAMAVLFTCFFAAGSVVWDREFGFLREMLVAPVSRFSLVLGKCMGGATVGLIQGLLVLPVAGLVGVPYSPGLLLALIGQMLVMAFSVTAMALAIAARMRSFPGFMAVTQMTLMPLFFLSGALFPQQGLPGWLSILTRLDPLAYAVDPIRRTVLAYVPGGASFTGMHWGTAVVPVSVELLIVFAFGLVALGVATLQFRKMD
jgi:ABC-2 type transport system permease protein